MNQYKPQWSGEELLVMSPLSNLKPVFYRVKEALEIHSGWIDPETGDIWDTVYDNQKAVKVVPGAPSR